MGTKLDFVILGLDCESAQQLWNAALSELGRLDGMLDRFKPSSEVSRINASPNPLEFPRSREMETVLTLCSEYRSATGGLFDVRAGGEYDFGGFAKGYFLKKCLEMLRGASVRDAFINFGNSTILGLGRNPAGESWSVDLIDPYSGLALDRIILEDGTLSTSGNTPGYSGHTINPHTGKGVEDRRLVTAVSADPLQAEVLSTALMAGGPGSLPMLSEAFPSASLRIHSL